MEKLTIADLKEQNLIIYEYIAGSTLYGLNGPGSDIDVRGVYVAPVDRFFSCDKNAYQEQVTDDKSDIVYYELKKYLELLRTSNPNILESLSVPADKINILNDDFKIILDNKEKFISKEGVKPLIGYANSQIRKATGLNKKIAKPVYDRKYPLDFCYVPYKQGSEPISKFLSRHGLKQEYCGLAAIPNMHDTYGVYYDYKQHHEMEHYDDVFNCNNDKDCYNFLSFYLEKHPENNSNLLYLKDCIIKNSENLKFKGIVGENSNELRLSSIPKGHYPICTMTYNEQGYTIHCKEYREYKEWEKNRNPERFKLNCENARNYDCKNISHCVRLLTMGKEILEGKGLNVVRHEDRQFILDIKHGKYTYEHIIKYADALLEEIRNIEKTSDLPDTIDYEFLNEFGIKLRRKIYNC